MVGRKIGRLTAMEVSRASEKGMYPDGGGLYLQVGPSGNRSWIFRYTLRGRPHEMGLGPFHAFTLGEARTRAAKCRQQLADRIDPLEAKRNEQRQANLESARSMTFSECAAAYIDAHKAGWRNAKHGAQWKATLDAYAAPAFGPVAVQDVDTALVMKALDPIWSTKPETASRVRGRVEAVLDWAAARGYRVGENPARWRGHLENLLPKRSKVRRVAHHPALPYDQIGGFMTDLRAQSGTAAKALDFLVLTAARTGEVIGATWSEIDVDAKVWTVPAERIKAGKEQRVPLSAPALAILAELRPAQPAASTFVFAGGKVGKPLSNMAMLKLLERMGRSDLTAHGFRSTFRDWAAELTNFPREVAEAALAHAIPDKVEAAYRRGDLFAKRRQLMEAWARQCAAPSPASKVVPLNALS